MSHCDRFSNQPGSPSQAKAAIKAAVNACMENPREPSATVARLHGVKPNSVHIALARQKRKSQRQAPVKHGGGNKILEQEHELALLEYVADQATEGLGATKQMLFAAICHLLRSEGKSDPSWRWFQKWLKAHADELHAIKTKPIALARVESHTEETIVTWFAKLRDVMEEREITKARQIHNFDETGVRVGCPGSEEILVPSSMKEKYTASPDNRVSVSIIESVCADGSEPPPPVIICPGKRHMENWYSENMKGDEMIMLSDSGYTNEQLAMKWLSHFIKHTRAGPTNEWKLLLIDGHKSHVTPQFTLLCLENHVQPFVFPSHMTHVLQPLDVGVFRPWKHWHKMAIQSALRSLDLDYSISSLFRDLAKIREQTFKPDTIKNAYAEAGIWPVSCKQALEKMRQYNGGKTGDASPPEEPPLPSMPSTPKSIHQSQRSMQEWENRVPEILSSPSAGRFQKSIKGVKVNLKRAAITEMEHTVLKRQMTEQSKRKLTSRKSVQTGGSLDAGWALRKIKEKRQTERSEALRKARRACDDWTRKSKKAHDSAGVVARRENRTNKKTVAELEAKNLHVPSELRSAVRDPTKDPTEAELEALLPHPSLLQEVQRLERENMNDDIQINPQVAAECPKINQHSCHVNMASESEDGEDSAESSGEDEDLITSNADFIPF